MQFKYIILEILFIIFILSCHHKPKPKVFSSIELERISKEFKLPKEQSFMLDTGYVHYLLSLDTSKYANEIQNHYQPIQALYYDKAGNLISFHINCYAGFGVKDGDQLNWNQLNVFSSFVPKTIVPLDTILSLSKHLQFIKTFENKSIDTTGFSSFNYTVIIHWGKTWRPKDCINLFNIVNENILLAKIEKVHVLYVNDDNN